MEKMFPYAMTFIIALVAGMVLTPVSRKLAMRFGALAMPDPRKVHRKPTPQWGGLAIATGFFTASVLSFMLFETFQLQLDPRTWRHLLGLSSGGVMMLILGMADDRFNIPAKVKLAGQLVIAAVLIQSGVAITFLTIPFVGLVYLPWWMSWGLSLLWIVGITNAINLLDGLDGLLAGVSTIFAILFYVVAMARGQAVVAVLMMALAGASLGFLRYNFNPARIFMGDAGSLFLGLMFAGLSIIGALKVTTTAAVFVPVLILGLPIFDTSLAILRRTFAGRPIFSPDREHVHHQLLARGLSVPQAVAIIYALSGTLGAIGISLALLLP